MSKTVLNPEAQALLDAANKLFPGRYIIKLEEVGVFQKRYAYVGYDIIPAQGHKRRTIYTDTNQLLVAKKVMTSAKLSASNGNRHYEKGSEPVARSITLFPGEWAGLERRAKAEGLTLAEWLKKQSQ